MDRKKVFVSSVQKELEPERLALFSLLTTDPVLSHYLEPVLFERLPPPTHAREKPYLKVLKSCSIFVLMIDREYGCAELHKSPTQQECGRQMVSEGIWCDVQYGLSGFERISGIRPSCPGGCRPRNPVCAQGQPVMNLSIIYRYFTRIYRFSYVFESTATRTACRTWSRDLSIIYRPTTGIYRYRRVRSGPKGNAVRFPETAWELWRTQPIRGASRFGDCGAFPYQAMGWGS